MVQCQRTLHRQTGPILLPWSLMCEVLVIRKWKILKSKYPPFSVSFYSCVLVLVPYQWCKNLYQVALPLTLLPRPGWYSVISSPSELYVFPVGKNIPLSILWHVRQVGSAWFAPTLTLNEVWVLWSLQPSSGETATRITKQGYWEPLKYFQIWMTQSLATKMWLQSISLRYHIIDRPWVLGINVLDSYNCSYDLIRCIEQS